MIVEGLVPVRDLFIFHYDDIPFKFQASHSMNHKKITV